MLKSQDTDNMKQNYKWYFFKKHH